MRAIVLLVKRRIGYTVLGSRVLVTALGLWAAMLAGMPTSSRRSQLWIAISSLLAVACGAATRSEPARPAARGVQVPSPRPADNLYAADEALRDALSGQWEYVGTGPWPGNNRLQACAFRNDRVLVVNAYCSIKEAQAFRIDVYSPRRGRVRIYAESKGPVSARTRQDYFTFTAETEPPPGPEARLPTPALTMSFEQLRAYEERRYRAFLPGCFGGLERSRKRSGCLGALASRESAWTERHRAFFERASADWYRVVRDMRALATRYGRDPE